MKSLASVSQAGLSLHTWPDLKLQRKIEVSASNLYTAVFSPNGKLLAIGGGNPSEEGIVQVFSWPGGKSVAKIGEHADSVRAISWKGNDRVLTASLDREVKLFNLENPASALRTYKGHSRGVAALQVLAGGEVLVSTGTWNPGSSFAV